MGTLDKLRALARQKLDAAKEQPALIRRALHVADVVNELLGQPIPPAPETPRAAPASKPAARIQAPVSVYFDGRDHRTLAKVEELLRGRGVAYKVLDVTDDEAERSWVTTAARTTELPVVVIGGTPVGGLAELTQLDLEGQLTRRVFGPF